MRNKRPAINKYRGVPQNMGLAKYRPTQEEKGSEIIVMPKQSYSIVPSGQSAN